jgi:hypothetical protein
MRVFLIAMSIFPGRGGDQSLQPVRQRRQGNKGRIQAICKLVRFPGGVAARGSHYVSTISTNVDAVSDAN